MIRAPHRLATNRSRPHPARLCAISVCTTLLACAHASGMQTTPAAVSPKPDPVAVQEALETDACRPGEPSRGCPADSFTAQPYVSARAYAHLLAALLSVQTEDFTTASNELREALLYDPESAHLHTLLADALVHLGRIGDADDELRTALVADPQHGPAHLLAARIAGARGRVVEARTHLRAAIEADRESPDAYRELVHFEASVPDAVAASAAAVALEAQVDEMNTRSQAAEKAELLAQDHPGAVEPDPDGALLASAMRLREESGRAWAEVARAFADKHDDPAAEAAFARAEAVDPTGLEQLASHAAFLETRRRFPEARDAELKLLARRPEAPEVLASLARFALEAGDAESAQAHLRKLIDLSSDLEVPATLSAAEPTELVDARRELASALLRAGLPLLGARRPAAAAPAFDAALRLLPDHPELLFYRALCLAGRGRAHEAAQQLTRVAMLATSHPMPSLLGLAPAALVLDARVQAALAEGRAGEFASSLSELRELFNANPLDEGAALGLLEGYDRAGRARDVIPLLAGTLTLYPGNASLLFALANAQDRAGRNDDALQTMRRLLAVSPDHAGALNYVGYSLVEKGTPAGLADAQRLLERAVELRPDDGAIADSYGLCLLKLGRAREALVELRRADALTPGDPVVLGHLGDALSATGARQEAEATFHRALGRLQPAPAKHGHRGRASARASGSGRDSDALEDRDDSTLEDRAPEANDAHVKAELLEKLRALTAH